MRGFTEEDFARSHPGGRLGRRLTLRVGDIMRTQEQIPAVRDGTSLADALVEMSRKAMGFTAIVDAHNHLRGVFTDGDLRRALDERADIHATSIETVMVQHCKRVTADELATRAVDLLEAHRITALPVVADDDTLVGALNVHDLLRAGVM
jgi:arabinose-5-phosphate isomerase